MAGGGNKGGSSESTVRLDPRIEEAAAQTVALAMQSAGQEPTPNRGITIADFTGQQRAAFDGANAAAAAFGMPTGDVIPQSTQSTSSGFAGYSIGDLYDANVDASLTAEQRAERQNILDQFKSTGEQVASMKGHSSSGGGK